MSSRQWVQKQRNIFSKGLKREARNCQQRGVKRAQRPRGMVWTKKVRNILSDGNIYVFLKTIYRTGLLHLYRPRCTWHAHTFRPEARLS